MRLTWRDGVATLLVALIGVPYVGYLLQGEMPFIKDPRGMSAVGLVLGVAAFFVARRPSREPHDAVTTAEDVLGVVAFGVGVIALILAEAAVAETLLAIFMAAIAVVWAVQMLHHAGVLSAGEGMRAVHR
jgi:hypothetical protein